ncbi:MAG: signal peptidase I [Dysgonamonadaceae bacterium]|jgi:signal peptidase I|nr:signal peptidase I [Dysgonamonadaceae bacterium]
MRKATKSQWLFFGIWTLLLILFTLWVGNYWLLLGILLIFDIYISKLIPWGGWKKSKNPALRKIAEWTDAIVFALVAVYIINLFIFQNYKIPTPSLEKTLLVGDYLIVSKLSYGPRVPNTPLSFPLAQHTLPIINTKSYIEWPQWPYKRLKGLGEVKRNDIVVFNFPAGDTVALYRQNQDYHELVAQLGWDAVNRNPRDFGEIVYRPVDRRENYVKRCVGLPGENLEIRDNIVYIDGNALPTPKKAQFNYFFATSGSFLSPRQIQQLGISKDDLQNALVSGSPEAYAGLGIEPLANGQYGPVYCLPLTAEAVKIIEKNGWGKVIIQPDYYGGKVYPYNYDMGWTRDNFGPLWIPKKGRSIKLDERNAALYERCIKNYEGNEMKVEGGKVYINGKPSDEYTFKYDYYFMMGDNRHNSLDSRYWGFVPEDHIVGSPVLVLLSLDKDKSLFKGGIRWNRIFRTVKAD